MATEIEYEKTYLAKRLPEGLSGANSVEIRDIYIPEAAEHATLRLRSKNGNYEMTKKIPVTGNDSSVQYEHTIELSYAEFEALRRCSKKDFVKHRYFIKINGRTAEVDVFGEKLKGLVILDFEFTSMEEKDAFEMPEVCLADVTQEAAIAGGVLAGKMLQEILPQLAKYNYKPIGVGNEI